MVGLINNYDDIEEIKTTLIIDNYTGIIIIESAILNKIQMATTMNILEKYLNNSSIFGIFIINTENIQIYDKDVEMFDDLKDRLKKKNDLFFSNITEDGFILSEDYMSSIELIMLKTIFNILELKIHIFFKKENIYLVTQHFANICYHFLNDKFYIDETTKILKIKKIK